ncbi:MAG: hypothetical protein HYY04_07010 [Chloroflexi bacterium]|nr:hypothetical protein [Chloroflexota bacterium]
MTARDLGWLTPEIEEVQAHHRARVAALYRGETPDEVIAVGGKPMGRSHGLRGTAEIDMLENPEAWLDDVFADMAANATLFADRVTFRPLAIDLDYLGVHYIDAIFGARVFHCGTQFWSDELACDVADLEMPDLDRSDVFQRSIRLARLAVAASRGRILVTTPILSCPANIGVNILGQRLLEALIDRPAAARHALRVITDTILAVARAFVEVIPEPIRRYWAVGSRYAPPGFSQIPSCSTQLISALQYGEFFAPLDAEVLGVVRNGGQSHLCGRHSQHIPTWARMPELRSVQLNDRATEDIERYFHGLRPDQILYVAPTATTPVERIIEITGGKRLILQRPLEKPIPLRNGRRKEDSTDG